MADQPSRPAFKDGQPLGAADLDLIVDGARDRAARHERGAHTPGIVTGLELRATDAVQGGVAVKDITITAGIAVDAAGRQIVLPADQRLPPEQFDADGGSRDPDPSIPGAQTSYPHPVFLTLDEREVQASAFGACGEAGGGGRIIEDQQIRIGRRGEHLDLAAQPSPGPGEELGSVTSSYRILLGFVRAHSIGRWAAVVDAVDNVRARRAGVRAGEVVTPGDRLMMRAGDPLAAGQPVLVVDTAVEGQLLFGKTSATGGVDEVFTVTADGNILIKGRLFPTPEAGTLWMYSAVATDGMPLALPTGVNPADVAAGNISVHTTITPRYPPAGGSAFLVGRCEIDADLVVHCSLFQANTTGRVRLTAVPLAIANVTVTAILRTPANSGGTP
jgi:hypothetical protein